MISIPPTRAGVERLAGFAARWGSAWFYCDKLRIAVSTHERPELGDLLVLHTQGPVTAQEIHELLLLELEN